MSFISPRFCRTTILLAIAFSSASGYSEERKNSLEEVIVTAQKREELLQKSPIAVTALNSDQLQTMRVTSLDDLSRGQIPSLRVNPSFEAASSLAFAIRGDGPSDITPVGRESRVGVYKDGILLFRPQGLSMRLPDLERIEALRGPQGTLFGKNTTGGAINLISKKPTGTFDIDQTVTAGNYDLLESITRLNLPEIGGLRSKLSYMHSQRDGLVENTAPAQADFEARQSDAAELNLSWDFGPVTIAYGYDQSREVFTSNYFQLETDLTGLVGNEDSRVSHTRAPLPLRPTTTRQRGHSLTVSWDPSEVISFKSITGYRHLTESAYTNYDVSVPDGLIFDIDGKQDSFSQEFQFIGQSEQISWIGGLYYFKGNAKEIVDTLFSRDFMGALPGDEPNAQISPTSIIPELGVEAPQQTIKAHILSKAIFGQATWTPEILANKLHITLGTRYTHDSKDGSRTDAMFTPFDIDNHHTDTAITIAYDFDDDFMAYAKRSTGFRSGGVNRRSISFEPYDPETVVTWEIGTKSEFNDRRVRLNTAVFRNNFDKKQIEVPSPVDATVAETINAEKGVRVDGAEVELTVLPIEGLVIGANYTYLDGHMPMQPNPLGGDPRTIYLTQTPKHAGSFSVDYNFGKQKLGTPTAHIDVTSSSAFRYVSDTAYQKSFTLLNARIALEDIDVGHNGTLRVAIWGNNLTNQDTVTTAFQLGEPVYLVARVLGDPRTFGLDVTYHLH